ncbi:hypothetical protein LPJ66_001102 [Kickxella alabastrina]|uniref:Uncharacterized protein n=1 Tax=Kickxella alabastrina TaxID=61397 RepID=A0ACC1IU70_9FUNG|nr:hypothetical protein LPJ66_001102 [Kickxella alabastrina]
MKFNPTVLVAVLSAFLVASAVNGACVSKSEPNATTSSIAENSSKIPEPTSSAIEGSTGSGKDTTTSTESGLITLEQLDKANSDASKASFCSSASADECMVNADAVAYLNKAVEKYKFTRRGETIAVISNMLFESVGWMYNIKHSANTPGQGTRCMMMWNFISEYAKELHPDEYAKLMGSSASSADSASDTVRNDVRELVLNPEDSFASGFWFLVNKAAEFHNDDMKLRDGNLEDFKAYVVSGIHTPWDSNREKWWQLVNDNLMV